MKNDKVGVSRMVIFFSILIIIFAVVYLLQNLVQSNKVVINDQAAGRPTGSPVAALPADKDPHSYAHCLVPNYGSAHNLIISLNPNDKNSLIATRALKIFTTTNVRGSDYTYLGQIDPKNILSDNKVLTINTSGFKSGDYTFYAWQFSPLTVPTPSSNQQKPISIPTPTHPPKEIADGLLKCIIFRIH